MIVILPINILVLISSHYKGWVRIFKWHTVEYTTTSAFFHSDHMWSCCNSYDPVWLPKTIVE